MEIPLKYQELIGNIEELVVMFEQKELSFNQKLDRLIKYLNIVIMISDIAKGNK